MSSSRPRSATYQPINRPSSKTWIRIKLSCIFSINASISKCWGRMVGQIPSMVDLNLYICICIFICIFICICIWYQYMFHQYLNQLMCKDGRWGQGVKTPQWWIGVKLGSRLISAHCRQIWGCMGPANDAIFGPWCMISHHWWSPQSWNSNLILYNLVNWGPGWSIV